MHTKLLPLLLTVPLVAQSVVVPNTTTSTAGTGGLNTIIRNAANPRSYQMGINAAQLAGIPPGSVITGVSFRFSESASNPLSWPAADITWTNYDIFLGPAIPVATWTGNTATNFASTPQQVRSGPMVLDAGSFQNPPGTQNPWSEFYFDFQIPYPYAGGDLAILLSHPGSTDTATPPFPETVASNAATHGVGRSQSVYPAGTASAATTFYVMRVHYGYGAGCPGTSGTAPVLVQNGNTTGGAGGTIRLTLANAPAGAIGVFAIGFAPILVPIGFGCNLLVTLDILEPVLINANGRAVLNIPIAPGVLGNLFAQAGVLDPGAPGGLTVTNGVSPSAN
jgi:hypothetical protein